MFEKNSVDTFAALNIRRLIDLWRCYDIDRSDITRRETELDVRGRTAGKIYLDGFVL